MGEFIDRSMGDAHIWCLNSLCDQQTSKTWVLPPSTEVITDSAQYPTNPLCIHTLLEYLRPLIYTLGIQFFCVRLSVTNLFHHWCFCYFLFNWNSQRSQAQKTAFRNLSRFPSSECASTWSASAWNGSASVSLDSALPCFPSYLKRMTSRDAQGIINC